MRTSPGIARLLAIASRINLPLLLAVAAGFALTAWFTLRVSEWTVMTDELQYEKLGLHIAQTLSLAPVVRGAHVGSYAQLYPLLTAPAWGLFSVPTAFKVVHALNVLIMASTAIPAYLLTRRVVEWRPAAWIVALLTVVVPWMAMSTMVMTEVAGYPAFVWGVLGMQATLARPSARNDLLAIAAIALAFFGRTQFLVLALALPITVVLHEVGFALRSPSALGWTARLRAALAAIVRRHVVLTVATALGFVVLVALLSSGRTDLVLGNYGGTTSGSLFPPGSADFAAQLLGILGVGIGVIPFVAAAGWAGSTLWRPTDRRGHAFAALLLVVTVLITAEVASFLIRFSGSVQDRYIFCLAPLAFIGMVACLLDVRRRWIGVAVAAGGFALLTTQTDFSQKGARPFFASPVSAFNVVLDGRSRWLGSLFGIHALSPRPVIIVATLLLGALVVLAMRRLALRTALLAAAAVVLVFCVVETAYSSDRVVKPISGNPVTGRDWIDARVPSGSYAALLPGDVNQRPDGVPVFLNSYVQNANWWGVEFWNNKVERGYALSGDPTGSGTPFATTPLKVSPATGAVTPQLSTRWVVVSNSDVLMRLRGASPGVGPLGLELVHAAAPSQADWTTTGGLMSDGWTLPGKPFTLRLFSGPGLANRIRRVSLQLDSIPEIKVARSYKITSAGATVSGAIPANSFRTVSIDVCTGTARHTDVTVAIAGSTMVPWLTHNPVGLHVSKIDVSAPGRSCPPAIPSGAR